MSEPSNPMDMSLDRAVGIVAAYVSNNSLRASDLPDLIASVHSSIRQLAQGQAPVPAAAPATPSVPIKKSVTKDYVVCLEDGKHFKSLRRHLSSFHSMTPEQYRTKWDLPSDYPMVAPSYSATRSRLAKDSGLGLVGKDAEPAKSVADKAEPSTKPRRGRPRKTD